MRNTSKTGEHVLRRTLRKRLWALRVGPFLLGALALGLLAFVACGSDDEKTGGTLRVAVTPEFNTIDPPLLSALSDLNIAQHTYDTLVMRNPDLSYQPMLATSWEPNDDATQWTFNLRKGVKFHHGKEFKAEDVVYTIERMFEVESALASTLPEDMKVVAVDDYTVRFDFMEPYAPLLDTLVKYHALITPSDVDPERFKTETLGTGPFIMMEHVIGEFTHFVRNEDYWWEGHPLLDEWFFIYLPDPTARAEALKAGTVDVIYDLDTASVPTLRDHSDTLVAVAPTGGYINLAMNVTKPPFDNVLVRKAVQAATDREAVLQVSQFGLGGIAYDHPITQTDPFFNPDCAPPDYDTELAKDLLAQAGYPDGIDLTLYTSTAWGGMVDMATVMKERAAPAGINIDVEVMPEDGYWTDGWMVEPFVTVGWGGRPPHEAMSIVYKSGAAWNESFYNNPEVDRLIAEGASAGDSEARKKAYGELQCLLIDEVPRIIPVFSPGVLGLRQDVRGLEPMWDKMLQLHRTWLDR